MKDIRKQNRFFYTQSSLKVFLECPYKFKVKYFQGLNKSEDSENIKKGREFHLIAQRYFLNFGDLIYEGVSNGMKESIDSLVAEFPLKKTYKYFPEVEIRKRDDNLKLLARYDLVIVKPQNKLQIIDFKLGEKKIDEKYLKDSLQTKIYLYILYENYKLIVNSNKKIGSLEMIYFQPNFPKEKILIKYSEEKHHENKKFLQKIIENIEGFNFETLEKQRVKYCNLCNLQKNCWKS